MEDVKRDIETVTKQNDKSGVSAHHHDRCVFVGEEEEVSLKQQSMLSSELPSLVVGLAQLARHGKEVL